MLLRSRVKNLTAATQGMEERGSLSPFLSIRNAVKDFPGQHSLDRSTFSSFNFDGRLTAKDGGGCVTFATDE